MADRRIENSRLLRHRLVRGSVHYASTPTLVSVGLNDQDPSPYSSTSSNEDSALDSSDTNNDGKIFGMISENINILMENNNKDLQLLIYFAIYIRYHST